MYLNLGRDSTWSAYCLLPTKMLAIFAGGLQAKVGGQDAGLKLIFTKSYEIRRSVSFLAKFFKIEVSVRLDADEKLKLFYYSVYFFYYSWLHCTFWHYSWVPL